MSSKETVIVTQNEIGSFVVVKQTKPARGVSKKNFLQIKKR